MEIAAGYLDLAQLLIIGGIVLAQHCALHIQSRRLEIPDTHIRDAAPEEDVWIRRIKLRAPLERRASFRETKLGEPQQADVIVKRRIAGRKSRRQLVLADRFVIA